MPRTSGRIAAKPFDEAIVARVKACRKALALSQAAVGGMIGVTQQGLEQYEKGASCLSAGQLYMLSKGMGVPMNFFYDELE